MMLILLIIFWAGSFRPQSPLWSHLLHGRCKTIALCIYVNENENILILRFCFIQIRTMKQLNSVIVPRAGNGDFSWWSRNEFPWHWVVIINFRSWSLSRNPWASAAVEWFITLSWQSYYGWTCTYQYVETN